MGGFHLSNSKEFVLFPEFMLRRLFKQPGGGRRLRVSVESMFPKDYLQYLAMVVNANRHLEPFAYPDMDKEFLAEEDVLRIFKCQLENMELNGIRCFEKVELAWERSQPVMELTYSKEFFEDKGWLGRDREGF